MGPMILGHAPASVIAAARKQMDHGIIFAGQTEIEFEAARQTTFYANHNTIGTLSRR